MTCKSRSAIQGSASFLRIGTKQCWAAIQETTATITHDPLLAVTDNVNRIEQLLQNLLGNAIKYPSGSEPRIQPSETRGSESLITVTDNGIDVRESDQDRIFTVFKRTAHRSVPGSGVGLSAEL